MGHIKTISAHAGGKYAVSVDIYADIDNNYSSTQSKVTISCYGYLGTYTEVQSSGVVCYSSCNGQTQGDTSIVGNVYPNTHTSAGNPYSVHHEYFITKASSARTINWAIDIFNTTGMVHVSKAGDASGSFTVTALPVSSYANAIYHWATGFKCGEGNNSNGTAFKLSEVGFTQEANTSFVLDESNATSIPNGFYLGSTIGTNDVTGSWQNYPMGTRFAQQAKPMGFEYDYAPIAYNITYILDGGINHPANPSHYNVLYGVLLLEPNRTGYIFKGWKDQHGNICSNGINFNLSNTFSNAAEFASAMSKRTTGDLELTAIWQAREPQDVYLENGILYARAFIVDDSLTTVEIDKDGNVFASEFIPNSDNIYIEQGRLYAVDFIEGTP